MEQFENRWRERLVEVYEHPTDPASVITVGTSTIDGNIVNCVIESYATYKGRIEHHNWAPYA
jgi:Ni,Fe-hydrogenase III small subunit